MSKQNRPTDAFGGPPQRGNNISLVLVLAALAFFAVLQWTSRGGSDTPAPPATVAAVAESTPDATAAEEAATPADGTPAAQDNESTTQPATAPPPTATTQPTPTANAPPTPTRASDLPTIAYADLPPEAHDTISLIDAGGPFPYSRDGLTFQNRERILPRHPEGYYQEYTVITPGSSDRGARRIVTGAGGEMYYTDDHYASFREIVR